MLFQCPKCKSSFTSSIVKKKEEFDRYGHYDLNRVEEDCCLKCPKCKSVFKIHLEKLTEKR
jgi:hypothetical protein